MIDTIQFDLFLITSLIILFIPGPAVSYIAVQSTKQGWIAGVMAVLGLEVGTTCHVGAAVVGLSTVLSSSEIIFNTLKFSGAAYLIYLGVHRLLSCDMRQNKKLREHANPKQIFWRGMIVEILNPKTMLFFFAFLPQFVDRTKGSVVIQMLLLGLLFVELAICIDIFYVFIAEVASELLKVSKHLMRRQKCLESSAYV